MKDKYYTYYACVWQYIYIYIYIYIFGWIYCKNIFFFCFLPQSYIIWQKHKSVNFFQDQNVFRVCFSQFKFVYICDLTSIYCIFVHKLSYLLHFINLLTFLIVLAIVLFLIHIHIDRTKTSDRQAVIGHKVYTIPSSVFSLDLKTSTEVAFFRLSGNEFSPKRTFKSYRLHTYMSTGYETSWYNRHI